MSKNPFKVHNKPKFNVTEHEKFIDILYDSTLQLTFEKVVMFCCSIKKEYSQLSKKMTEYSLFFQLHICVKPDFLHILQPKQHIATLTINPDIYKICKNVKQCHSYNFSCLERFFF